MLTRSIHFGVSIGAAVMIAACSGSSVSVTSTAGSSSYPQPLTADQKVTIVFENYNLASAGLGREATLQLIDEFTAKFPNIRVETKAPQSTEIMASVQAAVVAGNPPDVAQLVFSELDFIVNNLGAKPIEDLVPPDELARHFEGFHPNGKKLGELSGKIYGMPYVFSTPTLFYNADLFRQAGLDPNRPPRTWAEVKQYALQIKDRTGKPGVNIACTGQFDWCLQGIIRSNGGRVLSEDRSRLQFAEPEAVAAIAMWQDLVKSGAHPTLSSADAQTAVFAGNLGMYLNTSVLQAPLITAAKDKWELRAAKMPSFEGKTPRPTNSGSALFVLSNDPIKQRAAWELVKFLTSERGYTIITSKIGYLPLRPAITKDPRYLKEWVDANPLILPNLEQLDGLEPWVSFPGPNYVQMREIFTKAVEQTITTDADPRATLATAQARASELMPRR